MYVLDSGERLCKRHFLRYVEKKVRKTLRVYNLVAPGDVVGVAVSGGKDSLSVLDLLVRIYQKNESVQFKALLVDEGIAGYRDQSLETAKRFCEKIGVPLTIVSYHESFGFPLDAVVGGRKPCSVCGVLRRRLLNVSAKGLGVTKLATGHNLDDEAQSLLMNQFRRNVAASARLGPMTGVRDHEGFVRRIKPLYFLSEKEVMVYAYLRGIVDQFNECPYNKESYRNQVREFLNGFEELYPGTKHALVSSFLEILPLLRAGVEKKGIKSCVRCGEPTSREICQSCRVLDEVKPA